MASGCAFLPWTAIRADEVDDYLRGEMAQRQIPGLALEVVRDSKVVKEAAYGFANLEMRVPVTPDTVFEIGSITKQFTAAGILLLAQERKLSVEDPITNYLASAPALWQDIRIRHLLTHTSGLKSYTGSEGFELRRHLTQKDFIEMAGRTALQFSPGTQWKYCNTGYNLLGFIIENVSGQPYWEFLHRRIFQPTTMCCTTDRNPAVVIPNRAAGYELNAHLRVNRDPDLTDVFAAGAIVSTVRDLAKWDAALSYNALLHPATKAMMWSPARLNDGNQTKYGFGWGIDSLDGHRNIGHSGSTSGFSSSLQRFPDDKLTIIILTNTGEEVATALANKVAAFFLKPQPRLP